VVKRGRTAVLKNLNCTIIYNVIKKEERGEHAFEAVEGFLYKMASQPIQKLEPQEQQLLVLPPGVDEINIH
jgi:hypothetical protein